MSEVLFEMRGAVLVVTFNRPDRGNALTAFMAKAMCDKLKSITDDRQVRAVLLRGAGDHFMDGHEMGIFSGDTNALQDQTYQKVQFFYTTIRELQTMDRPVIAALDGRVSGAGWSFMLAADLIIASDRTIFNSGFIPHAMVPDGGVTFALPRKLGAARAMQLLMLSEDFSARDAERWGLVSRVVDPRSLSTDALGWAEKVSMGPTRILGATKRLIGQAFSQDLAQQLSAESVAWTAGAKSFDFRDAMKARIAGKEPKFTGS